MYVRATVCWRYFDDSEEDKDRKIEFAVRRPATESIVYTLFFKYSPLFSSPLFFTSLLSILIVIQLLHYSTLQSFLLYSSLCSSPFSRPSNHLLPDYNSVFKIFTFPFLSFLLYLLISPLLSDPRTYLYIAPLPLFSFLLISPLCPFLSPLYSVVFPSLLSPSLCLHTCITVS